jgi:hypothetical protein
LAEAEPAGYLPDLASALNNLGIRLSQVGDKRGALAPTEEASASTGLVAIKEATAIYRSLVEALPAAFTSYLRFALSVQAEVLDGLGRAEEADELPRALDENDGR